MKKASKREKPVYGFVRRGDALVPDMAHDYRALDGIQQGELVRVDIRQWRNVGRHRAYWAMLGDVVAATDATLTAERLHEVLKLELGIVDLVRLPGGMTVAIPGSIAFEAMEEAEFVTFFKRAEEWLALTYGYVNERERSAA